MRILVMMILVGLLSGCNPESETNETETQNQVGSHETEVEVKVPKKVIGIGGIFFKSKDPEKIKEWYQKNLGLKTDKYGTMFEFRNADDPEQIGYLQWSPFSDKTEYFEPSKKEFMINYRVENLENLLEELAKEGVEIIGEMETYEYGKFAHIMDPEGNKIELWEPIDAAFTKENEDKETTD